MDWTAEEIRSNPFTHYELDNESRALSGYHIYTKCTFEGYTTMDEAQRLVYIMQTHNLNDEGILDDDDIADIIDSSDFQAKKVVIGVWRLMLEGKKSAWKERANLLNNRPLLGQVEELPEDLAAMNLLQLQDLVRECIRIDLSLLEKMLKRALRNENQRDLGKKKVQFPYSIEIESQIYRTGTLSTLLGRVIFGEKMSKLHQWELISKAGSDPFTYHFFGMDRLHEIFTFQDLVVLLVKDNRADETTHLCSYGVVQNMLGQSTKAYVTAESRNTVTLTLCEEENGATHSLTFPKPSLYIRDEPPRQIVGYICGPDIVDGYKIIQINPACLYLSHKNTGNFKLLASKVCFDCEGRIVKNKST